MESTGGRPIWQRRSWHDSSGEGRGGDEGDSENEGKGGEIDITSSAEGRGEGKGGDEWDSSSVSENGSKAGGDDGR